MTFDFQQMLILYPVRTCFVFLVAAQAVVYVICSFFKAMGGGYVYTRCDDCTDSDYPEDSE